MQYDHTCSFHVSYCYTLLLLSAARPGVSFALSNYSKYKLSYDTCVGGILLVVQEIQPCTSYYVAVVFAIYRAPNMDQLMEINGLLWLQCCIVATCHGYNVLNAQGFKVQATMEKDQAKEIAQLLNEDGSNSSAML